MKNRKEILAFITKAIGVVVVAVSLVVIVEHLLNIFSFSSELRSYSYSVTRFETAVCFFLSGCIFLLIRDSASTGRLRKRVSSILIFVLLLLACFFLFSKIFDWNFTFSGLWGARPLRISAAWNMNLIVAFNFIMLALTFLFLRKRKFHILAQVFLIALLPGSLLVILNRLYDPSFLSAVLSTVSVSIATPALFVLILAGLFLSPVLGYVHFSFLKKIALFFMLIILFRSIIFFALDKNNQLAADKETLIRQNQAVLVLAEKISSLSNNLQSSVRGYVITGQETMPSLSAQFKDSIERVFRSLRILTLNHTDQQHRLDTLEKDVGAFVDQENLLIGVRQHEGFAGAQNIIRGGKGSQLLGKVNEMVAFIEQAESQMVANHTARNDLIIQNSSNLFTLFQGVAFVLLIVAFQMIYEHITRRDRAEEALKKSLKETSDYKYALNESSILAIFDQDGIIKQVNDNLCRITQYSRGELIGQHLKILDSGYHSPNFMKSLLGTIAMGKEWKGELKRRAKDGSLFWLDTTIIPFIGDNGRPHQYVVIHFDITKRKDLEEEMMQFNVELQKQVQERTREVVENEQKYRFLLQNMNEGIQVINYQWEYVYLNDAAIRYSKLTEQDLLGRRIEDVFPGFEETEVFKVYQRCMTSRAPEILVNEFVFGDGTRQWFEYSIQPVAEGLFIRSIDITQRKKAEQQLEESEHFLNASQQVSKIGSYALDFGTGLWKGSTELSRIFGMTPEVEHSVEEWLAFIHPDNRESMRQYFEQEVIGKKERFDKEYKIINAISQRECWVHGIGDLEFHADGRLSKMLGTIQDITERRAIVEKLRVNNEWYELVNNATLDTIWDWDFATQKGTWGEGFCKTFGYSRDQLAFDTSWRKKFIHPDDLQRISENFTYYLDSFSDNWQDEYRFLCADGTYKYVYDRGYILRNADKRPYRSIGAITDISDRKRLEKELVQQQLRQHKLITEINIQAQEKERNELGRELHDNVNQILATVKLYLGMIKSGQSLGVEGLLEKSYDYVNDAMVEIRKLSHSLVAPSLGDISLQQALEELLEDTNLVGNVIVRLEMDTIFGQKYLDKNRELMIYRVVQEQLSNIIKYAGAGEAVVTLRTGEGNILLSISDNGKGFEPSEQIKGIGLKNIVSRVDLYAGKMNIISAPGMGCTLEVSIPL